MPLPSAPGGITWKDFVRPAPRTRRDANCSTAAVAPPPLPPPPFLCRAAVAKPRDPPVSESYVVPVVRRPKRTIARAETAPATAARTIHTEDAAKKSFHAWEARKKKESLEAKKKKRREAKTAARKRRNAARKLERRRRKLAHEQSMRAMQERISTIKFVEQENKSGQKQGCPSTAQRKLRQLQSMEWHLKKDLEEERRRIREMLEQEKVQERLKEERRAKWSQKPIKLSYSIRG
jgi:hypothetical protein